MRNLILSAALVTASLFGMTAQAADVPLEAGKTYVELANPVAVSVPGKIEVVELFWYGCPHCYAFEPTINPWVEKLPKDVNFKRIPAMFGGPWDAHGQLFLTLEAMGVEHKVHNAVFEAIQKQGKRLTKSEDRLTSSRPKVSTRTSSWPPSIPSPSRARSKPPRNSPWLMACKAFRP